MLHVYCDYQNRENQSKWELLSSILVQAIRCRLSKDADAMPKELFRAYLTHQSLTWGGMIDLLSTIVAKLKRPVIAVDGLDEYVQERGESVAIGTKIDIFDGIQEAVKKSASQCRILVTSRENCTRRYKDHATFLEIQAKREDIDLYVSGTLLHDPLNQFNFSNLDNEDRELIVQEIGNKAQNQYEPDFVILSFNSLTYH